MREANSPARADAPSAPRADVSANGNGRMEKQECCSKDSPLWTWCLSFVEKRVQSRLGWSPAFSSMVALEYRRFIELCTIHPELKIGMTGVVDEFWHEHILFTRDYHGFCCAVAGEYIHHAPSVDEDSEDPSAYSLTLSLLEARFGPINSEVWPTRGSEWCDSCSSCDKVGSLGVPSASVH